MTDLVPVGARDLIFEPTETLSARIISAVEEKKDAEERLKEMEALLQRERRKKTGANLRSMAFLGMAAAAGAGAFFIWSGTEGQIAKADQERDAAFEQRDEALEDLRQADTTIENQRQTIIGFDEFLPVADVTWEVRRLNAQIQGYASEFATRPTPGLNRDATINVEANPEDLNWMNTRLATLRAEESKLQTAITNFRAWVDRRVEEPPVEVCLPKNPFRQTPRQPNCPN